MQRESSAGYITRAPRSSGLADVLEILLDRGLVIDAFVRVSLVGIELLTVDLRVVVASVDTYLRFAEAVNRLDLQATSNAKSLPDLFGDAEEDGAQRKTKGGVVLPTRFGTVLDDHDAALELLALPDIEILLERHRDNSELTVKGTYEESILAEVSGPLEPLRAAYQRAPTLEAGIALGEAVT